jgi:uncharacterized protein YcbK (DUF882 family)
MSELLHSDEANRNKINNIPNDKQILDNLLLLITECLQPIRNYIGKPIKVTSGYRCQTLNNLPTIRGAKNSEHLTGCAADIVVSGMTPRQLIEKIKASGVEYRQLINEHNLWVHISYSKGNNIKQSLEIL